MAAEGGDEEEERLRHRLEQQQAMISALLSTHALLSAQTHAERTHLVSLAHQLGYNVASAGAKRKQADVGALADAHTLRERAVYRSADDLDARAGEADSNGPADCLPLAERVALLDAVASALEAAQGADAAARLRELERLKEMSLSLCI
ncbi:hypothetical protein KFE25_001441 [Diacronema lutheri]|uniref:Uncharacterized protein n=1 Tax=Diacronema lutheri TaxID=2081491 RepID=A0A8J5X8L1_DIALT|nr:hypothetical protein KFE25_001441 [Diacronema lutheri]